MKKADTTTPANADPVTWDALCREMAEKDAQAAAKDARIAQLEAELAAAVDDIDLVATCEVCKYGQNIKGKCPKKNSVECRFVWRGLRAE